MGNSATATKHESHVLKESPPKAFRPWRVTRGILYDEDFLKPLQ